MSHRFLCSVALILTLAIPFLFVAAPAQGQLAVGEIDRAPVNELFAAPASCSAAAAAAAAPRSTTLVSAQPLFYSLPLNALNDGKSEVLVKVLADGELYLEERFRLEKGAVVAAHERQREQLHQALNGAPLKSADEMRRSVVFELLADRGALRSQLLELGASADRALFVEVLVDGLSAEYVEWADFVEASAIALEAEGLPVGTEAAATVFQTAALPDGPQAFFVCGDGSCGGGSPPLGENCETCPQDCGGPCSICGNGFCGGTETCSTCPADCGVCDPCPEDLGTVERTDYLGSTGLYSYCMNAWPGTQYYTYTRNNYKRYDVQRTEECNGSITETVVPGSTTYFSAYCWKYTGAPCSYSYGYASPICF